MSQIRNEVAFYASASVGAFLIFGGIFMTEKNFDAQERVFNLLRELAENKKQIIYVVLCRIESIKNYRQIVEFMLL